MLELVTMGGSSHANEQTESFPEIGSFVMLFDLETDHWFKCKVTMETSNLVQVGMKAMS